MDRTRSKLCTKVLFLLKTSLPFTENATTFPKEFQNILISESVSVLKTLDLSWEINKKLLSTLPQRAAAQALGTGIRTHRTEESAETILGNEEKLGQKRGSRWRGRRSRPEPCGEARAQGKTIAEGR